MLLPYAATTDLIMALDLIFVLYYKNIYYLEQFWILFNNFFECIKVSKYLQFWNLSNTCLSIIIPGYRCLIYVNFHVKCFTFIL
jgi:hypothetical protein